MTTTRGARRAGRAAARPPASSRCTRDRRRLGRARARSGRPGVLARRSAGAPTCRWATAAAGAGDLLSVASRPDAGGRGDGRSTRLKPAARGRGACASSATTLKPVTDGAGAGTASTLRGVAFDSMLASYLLDATRSQHGVADTALEHLGYKAVERGRRLRQGRQGRAGVSDVAPEALLRYAGERADLARQLSRRLAPLLEAEGLAAVNRDSSSCRWSRAGRHRARRHARGHRGAGACSRRAARERSWPALSARIYELAGMEFNVNSPKQLGEVLFERLNLPALKKTGKTRSASTAVEVLEELATHHELPRLILDLAQPAEAEGHLRRCAAAAGQPEDRPRAHQLQPGRGRHRPLEQLRSEPAEHPDPHRDRPRDPPRVHRRAGPRADLGRLLADRAAGAGAPGRRRDR